MPLSLKSAARLTLLAGMMGVGCNSLVGNDTHHLDPSINNVGTAGSTGTAGAHTGGGFGHVGGSAGPTGGASGGATVSTGGVAAGGAPGSGGVTGGGGATTTGGATGNGGAHGSGGVVGTGGGTAGAGGMCIAPGNSCDASADCCQSGSTTPMGAVCIADDGLCHAKCTTASECVSNCCVMVMGETYGVCADAATYCPALKGTGDPCSANSECASGNCNAWCQASCAVGNSACDSTALRPRRAW